MANKTMPSEICVHLGRMITNELCECLEENADCPHKVIFGDGSFCTGRLSGRSARPVNNINRLEE